MANVSCDPRFDHLVSSATLRNLPPEFIANSQWDHAAQNDRLKRFLFRNMTRVSASHRKRSARALQSAKPVPAPADSSKPTTGNANSNGIHANGNLQVDGGGKSAGQKHVDAAPREHDTSISALEAMSAQTLLVKHKSDPYEPNKRQSLRRLFQKQHEDPNASLVINLRNIRKKLNWKEFKSTRAPPPRKRARLESIECDVFLTVWDNSASSTNKIPVVSKREFCELIKVRRDVDTTKGELVELKLDEPLIISHKELRVAARSGKERMALAKEYFMEIKIVPRDDHVSWPPIPMLGKSDGDRFTGMNFDSTEDINPSLIARYQHLPDPPDAETPLAIFVYAEGTTFRTKYGLEVDAKWVKRDHPDLIRNPSPEPRLEPWALDRDRKPFGRIDPTMKPISHTARKTVSTSKRRDTKLPKEPLITYTVRVPKGTMIDFNTWSVRGLKCYLCPEMMFDDLDELRFHLDQLHKNTYTLESEVMDPVDSTLVAATIRVGPIANQRPKSRQGHEVEEDDQGTIYVAPSVPFDLHAHYANKNTAWSEILPTQVSKEAVKVSPVESPTVDLQSVMRRENGGHIPYQHVLPFRPQQYQRRKFPNKKLLTKHFSLESPYTSVSHRPVQFENIEEDARSETDDEIDDSWFVKRHLEELDIHTWQENWSEARRRLAKKWDWHMLHRERGIGARYMGDCLIRFIRIEKKWILQEDKHFDDQSAFFAAQTESISALIDMMEELKTMGVINENVCGDVMTMLYDDKLHVPIEEQQEIENQAEDIARRERDIHRRAQFLRLREPPEGLSVAEARKLPSSICAACQSLISHDNQRAVRCSNLKCSSPNVWYHAKCAGVSIDGIGPREGFDSTQAAIVQDFMKARLAWKCRRCADPKGKEKAVPPVPIVAGVYIPIKQEEDHISIETPMVGREQSEATTEDDRFRSKSSSVMPCPPSQTSQYNPHRDVQVIIGSRKVVYTAYVDDRRSLRGIVLHHYHDQGRCHYAIVDERPTRSRSKKPHTVLATVREDDSVTGSHRYFIYFPDETKKRESERWWLPNRSLEAELLARFRPCQIQHYVEASECRTELCTCTLRDPTLLDGGCLQLEPKRMNDCKYGRDMLRKEPGRGFYVNEQDNPGTVWHGDYFDELQKVRTAEQKSPCGETTHTRCTHSVTAKETRYKNFGRVSREAWS